MKRSALASSVAACICCGLAGPLLAATPVDQPPVTGTATRASPDAQTVAATAPAQQCLSDLRAFHAQMGKSGYWLGASGYGYGYPMGGFGYGYGAPLVGTPVGGVAAGGEIGYRTARPGYEVRTLLAAANILAQNGQQQPCEDVLATTRTIYQRYAADLQRTGMRRADVPGWRHQQIADAKPVTSKSTAFRSDQLIGADVRDPQDQALGSVEDIVMSPKTGKIAYLVIARGGIFGIDESYVPVPWRDFKTTPNVNLLVLDTTKAALNAAPQVNNDKFATGSHFDQQSAKVDAYWKAHLSSTGSTASHG